MTSPTRTSSFAYPGARQIHPRNNANGGAGYHSRVTRHFLPIPNLINVETGHPWADAPIVGKPEATIVADLLLPRRATSHLPDIRLKPVELLTLSVKGDSRPRQERGDLDDQRESRSRHAQPPTRTPPRERPGIDTKQLELGGSTPARTLSRRVLGYLPALSRDGGASVKSGAQWVFVSRKPRRIGAALATMLGVWLCWGPIATAGIATLNSAAARIEPRAAFQVAENFKSGVSAEWYPRGLVADESGLVRVEGLALHRDTMDLDGYRWDFDAKITSRAVGWVVRASDTKNYYAYKLVQRHQARLPDGYRLMRYPVVNGQAEAVERDLEVEWKEGEFNRISVRVGDREIKIFINGWSVDYWLVPDLQPGGIGFLADQDEASLIGHVLVDSNSDFWGLTLYGALETMKAIEDFVSPYS